MRTLPLHVTTPPSLWNWKPVHVMCMWFCVGVPMGTCSLGWVLVYLCVRSSGSTGLATYVYGLTAQTRDIWICSIRWRAPSITVLLQCHPKASSKPFVPAPCSVMWPTSMPKRNESLAHELDAARRVLLCVKTVMKGKRERKKESDNESIHCWLIWKRLQLTHKHCKKTILTSIIQTLRMFLAKVSSNLFGHS